MNVSFFNGESVDSNRIVYTPSAFAKTNLIHLQETGTLKAKKPHINNRKGLVSFLFFVVVSGSGILMYDGEKYFLKEGDCIFIDCRKSYYHESSEDLWTLKWVHFYGFNMAGIYDKYMERCGMPYFRPNSIGDYCDTLDELFNIASSDDYIRDMKIFERLSKILTLVMEDSWQPHKNRKYSKKKQNLSEVKAYLDEHFAEKISLDYLSELFYINKFYLTRVFKEQFGTSINNYVLQKRITKAKQMLRFTDKTVEEIGLECGLGAGYYFSRMFKSYEGISPGEYRKNWLG